MTTKNRKKIELTDEEKDFLRPQLESGEYIMNCFVKSRGGDGMRLCDRMNGYAIVPLEEYRDLREQADYPPDENLDRQIATALWAHSQILELQNDEAG